MYTYDIEQAKFSRWSYPETVKKHGVLKKSLSILNKSPAPSQSELVIIGV